MAPRGTAKTAETPICAHVLQLLLNARAAISQVGAAHEIMDLKTVVHCPRSVLLAFLFATFATPPLLSSQLDEALQLQRAGKLRESKELLRTAAAGLRASGDARQLAHALSASSRISVALGEYADAIRDAGEAVEVRTRLHDPALAEDYNTIGLANLYLGKYDDAVSNYQKALGIDRQIGDGDGLVGRLNNIGNVYYFRGRYQDAQRAYQQAMDAVNHAGAQPWVAERRQLTIANLATLYQRLGKEQAALELYGQLTSDPQALQRVEYAQLLLNEGVLYRRLGDPLKALQRYGAAQSIFAAQHLRDGEIGALRNIGIVRVMDLGDLEGARASFTSALDLAHESSDMRGIVQASLYRAEVFRRLGRLGESESGFQTALAGARRIGLMEEQWKAEYGLGKLAEANSAPAAAEDWYRKAMADIESVRAGIRRRTLRTDFLADKREVYDALIALSLAKTEVPVSSIFSLMESSRARTLEERSPALAPKELTLAQAQQALRDDTVLVEYWAGEHDLAALWITRAGAGVVRSNWDERLSASIAAFEEALQSGGHDWQPLSLGIGKELLAGIPAARHAIIAPDGQLAELPFEALTNPSSGRLLIEDCDISYLPAARFYTPPRAWRLPLPPWRTEFIAYGDSPVSGADSLGDHTRWQPLQASADEIKSIAGLLPGKSQLHLGPAARKQDLLARRLQNVPLLHFATHAVEDAENPDRSRILMASDSPAAPLDYLFQQEIYGLNLKGVDLATVSACEAARGPVVRGDGVRAFSQAFLAAGASATVTPLWRVSDRPTAEFMEQFYYLLASNRSKAEALRSAKLKFLHSNSRLASPQYWSTFVLYGDGQDACARVLPWSWFLYAAALAIAIAAFWLRISQTRKAARAQLRQAAPAGLRAG